MEHTISLIWLASWPIFIYVVYRVTFAVLKHKNFMTGEGKNEN